MDVLRLFAVGLSLTLIALILVEGFETLVLPRRIERRLRFTKRFYQTMWNIWGAFLPLFPRSQRDNYLAVFGPLSLLLLLSLWALGLSLSFGFLLWGLKADVAAPEGTPTLSTYLYLSATTFITLGFGDVAPRSTLARIIADTEAGVGFGFLAIVIGYLPVLYGAFSRREVDIALLDARASSPPSAGALLERVGPCPDTGDLLGILRNYERWSAEVLESHLSYPVLMYYRSQHDRQSWLGALTTVLDTCAFLIALSPSSQVTWQARMTFAMARHAAVDLALVFDTPPSPPSPDRLPPERLQALCALITTAGMTLKTSPEATVRLNELRHLYEPFLNALAISLRLSLPAWMPNHDLPDNWQTSAWDRQDHFFQETTHTADLVLHEQTPRHLREPDKNMIK